MHSILFCDISCNLLHARVAVFDFHATCCTKTLYVYFMLHAIVACNMKYIAFSCNMLHESRTLLLLHATSCMKYRKTKLNAHSNIHYPTLLHRTCNKVASYMMGFMHTYTKQPKVFQQPDFQECLLKLA